MPEGDRHPPRICASNVAWAQVKMAHVINMVETREPLTGSTAPPQWTSSQLPSPLLFYYSRNPIIRLSGLVALGQLRYSALPNIGWFTWPATVASHEASRGRCEGALVGRGRGSPLSAWPTSQFPRRFLRFPCDGDGLYMAPCPCMLEDSECWLKVACPLNGIYSAMEPPNW